MNRWLVRIVLFATMGAGVGCNTDGYRGGALSVRVTDDRGSVTQDIDERLVLVLQGGESGWDVKVVEKPMTFASPNLLYHSAAWHGPYPTQVYPWNVAQRFFPNDRKLAVRGYPYGVTIRIVDIRIEGEGDRAKFKEGTILVRWDRAPKAGPAF